MKSLLAFLLMVLIGPQTALPGGYNVRSLIYYKDDPNRRQRRQLGWKRGIFAVDGPVENIFIHEPDLSFRS